MKSKPLKNFKYNGARSLILLQEKYLIEFVDLWFEAKNRKVVLPLTTDKDYESLESLLVHVLGAPGRYITWICEKLNLSVPHITKIPTTENIQSEARDYLEHITEIWRYPLIDIEEDRFYKPSFLSNWGSEYSIDGMMEHAVMHPIRHAFLLKNLLEDQEN